MADTRKFQQENEARARKGLKEAVQAGNLNLVKKLATPERQLQVFADENSCTSIVLAAYTGNLDVVSFLLKQIKEAKISNTFDRFQLGRVVLYLANKNTATIFEANRVFQLLEDCIELGADFSTQHFAQTGDTALHCVIQGRYWRYNDIFKLLLDHALSGALLIANSQGNTILHTLMHQDEGLCLSMLNLLLPKLTLTHFNLKNNKNNLALDIARKGNKIKFMQALLERAKELERSVDKNRIAIVDQLFKLIGDCASSFDQVKSLVRVEYFSDPSCPGKDGRSFRLIPYSVSKNKKEEFLYFLSMVENHSGSNRKDRFRLGQACCVLVGTEMEKPFRSDLEKEEGGVLEIFKRAFACGARIFYKTTADYDIFHYLLQLDNPAYADVFCFVLSQIDEGAVDPLLLGLKSSKKGWLPLHYLASRTDDESVQMLAALLPYTTLEHMTTLDAQGNSAFQLALAANNDKAIPLLQNQEKELQKKEARLDDAKTALKEYKEHHQVKGVRIGLNTPMGQILEKTGVRSKSSTVLFSVFQETAYNHRFLIDHKLEKIDEAVVNYLKTPDSLKYQQKPPTAVNLLHVHGLIEEKQTPLLTSPVTTRMRSPSVFETFVSTFTAAPQPEVVGTLSDRYQLKKM